MNEQHADRAKQFLPFAALTGLEDVLAARRSISEPRRELAEDEAAALSRKLGDIAKGDTVRVTYYHVDRYVACEGEVTSVDKVFRTIRIFKTDIAFDDVIDICVK